MTHPLQPTGRFSFPKTARLRNSPEFKAVYNQRCKASDGVLLIFAAVSKSSRARIGLSVSRKLGNAVVRNRLKRLLREAFRLSQAELPPNLDLIAIPQGAVRAGLLPYRQSLLKLALKLHRRINANPPQSESERPS